MVAECGPAREKFLVPVHATVHAAALAEPSRPAVLCVEAGVGGVRGLPTHDGEMWTYGEVDAMAEALSRSLVDVVGRAAPELRRCVRVDGEEEHGEEDHDGRSKRAGSDNGFRCVMVGVDEGVLLVVTILAAFK